MNARPSRFLRSTLNAATSPASLIALVAALLFAFTLLFNAMAGATGSSPAPAREQANDQVRELAELRTRTSRTFLTRDGANSTRVYAHSVNYRKGSGDFAPIDNTLVPSSVPGYALENKANRYSLRLPEDLGGEPVRVGTGGEWLSFGLRDARGGVAADGATATYRDALPGVDVRYTAAGDSVKEALELKRADAAQTFRFDVVTSDGLRPRETDSGGVEFVDADGKVQFAFAPSFMRDARGTTSDDVRVTVRRTTNGYEVALDPDRDWLADPARRYPVVVDPVVQVLPSSDCFIAGGSQANTSFCGSASNWLELGTDSSGNPRRAFAKFDLSAIPKTAQVIYGDVGFYYNDGTARDVALYQLNRSSTNARTWNTSDGTNSWPAGGDIGSSPDDTATNVGAGGAKYYHWYPHKLVQGWVDGSIANHGFLLKDSGTTSGVMRLRAQEQVGSEPFIEVKWKHRVGFQPQYTMISEQLTDRTSVAANVANGNLVLQEHDLNIAGRGLNQTVARYFNNLDVEGGDGNLGFAWNSSTGWDVWAAEYAGGSVVRFDGPSGFNEPFYRKSDGSYESPTALEMKLVKHSDGSFTLTENRTQEKMHFGCNFCSIDWHKDRNGNQLNFEYNGPGGKLSKITDTRNRATTFTYNGSGYISKMTDSNGREWSYGYTGNKLTSYTNPDNKTTSYGYDSALNLTQVTDPRGNITKMTYDSKYRVTTIKRVTDTATEGGPTWTFDYPTTPSSPCSSTHAGKTVVTDPRGKQTTYCWDRELRPVDVFDAKGNKQSAEYNANSNVTRTELPGSAVSTFGYDDSGASPTFNPRTGQDAAGAKSTLDYNHTAHPYLPSDSENAQGSKFKYAYDAPGNLTATTNGTSPTQIEAKVDRNTDGTIDKAYDGNGNMTDYSYNTLGELTEVTPPAITPTSRIQLGKTTFEHDPLSRVSKVWDGKHQPASTSTPQKTFTYDKLDRVTRVDFADGTWVSFAYDNNGNRTSRAEGSGGTTARTTSYTYDKLNRVMQESLPGGATNGYTYDLAGNLKTFTDAGGTVTYEYDDINLLKSLAEPGGSCVTPKSLCTELTVTDRGQRNVTTYPNGVTVDNDYDAGDKPTSITAKLGSTTLQSFTYTYQDSASTPRNTLLTQSVTDKDNNKTVYTYENSDTGGTSGPDRLIRARTAASGGGGALVDDYRYDYDKAGNIKKQEAQVGSGSAQTTTFSYNEGNQLCWKASGTPSSTACGSPPSGADSYVYDANGNLTSGAGRSYAYNVKNQTTSITPSGGSATALSYLGQSQNELTGIGSTTFQNNALGVGRQTSGGVASYFVRDSGGTLLGEKVGTARHYYIADNLGSIRGLTTSSGSLANTYRYEPYGKLASSTGSTSNPMKFVGGHDTGLGVYHFGARYYDPALARWSQQDPIDQAGDLREANRYVYAAGDPVNRADVSGLVSAEVSAGWGPANCGYGQANRNAKPRRSCGIQIPFKDKGSKFKFGLGVSGMGYSGDDSGGGVGVKSCLAVCFGANTDKGLGFGGGLEFGVTVEGVENLNPF